MAFGAGVLISAVAYELVFEAMTAGENDTVFPVTTASSPAPPYFFVR